jgi:hypothetical protein
VRQTKIKKRAARNLVFVGNLLGLFFNAEIVSIISSETSNPT